MHMSERMSSSGGVDARRSTAVAMEMYKSEKHPLHVYTRLGVRIAAPGCLGSIGANCWPTGLAVSGLQTQWRLPLRLKRSYYGKRRQ